jgi:hypothetical protein
MPSVTATQAVATSELVGWLAAITTAAANIQLGSDFVADMIYADPARAAHLLALVLAEAPAGTKTVAGLRLESSNGLAASEPMVIGVRYVDGEPTS